MAFSLTASAAQANDDSNPVTFVFDCNAGDLLVIGLALNTPSNVGVPTYNSVSMTDSGQGTVSEAIVHVEQFYLVSPASGSQTISIANPDEKNIAIFASAWSGVDTADPLDTSASNHAISDNPSTLITTSAAGELIVDIVSMAAGGNYSSNSHTLLSEIQAVSDQYTLDDGSSGVTLSWTHASSANWTHIVAAFNPAGGGATFFKTITATAVGNAAMLKLSSFFRTISATAVGNAVESRIATFPRALTATAVGIAGETHARIVEKLLQATAIGVAVESRITTFYRTIAATAIGIATEGRITSFFRAIPATAIGVAVETHARISEKLLQATAIGIAVESRTATFSRALSAIAIGIGNVTRSSTFYRTFAATATGIGSVFKGLFETIIAIAIGIATAIAAIPGPDEPCDFNIECSIPTKVVTANIPLKAVAASTGSAGNDASASIPIKSITGNIPEKEIEVEPCLI